MNIRVNIAIDGYSSCGKSTLAKTLAKELNYVYIDTGAMYRAVSLFALKNNFAKDGELDNVGLIKALDNLYIMFKYNIDAQRSETYLNGNNVELEIRSIQVSNYVSQVADIPEVRQKLVRQQQRMAASKGVVMDGRDIGTVVMPDSEIKFFMTADKNVRAQRRFDELKAKGVEVSMEEVVNNLNMRDHIDTHRSNDPLRQADDAIIIDNSDLTMEEQFDFAMSVIKKKIEDIEKKSLELSGDLEQ